MDSEESQFKKMIVGNQSFTSVSVYISLFNISFNLTSSQSGMRPRTEGGKKQQLLLVNGS